MEAGSPGGRRWFGLSLWLHRWTGLVAAPFFLILCLTGSVLIFHEEVDRLLGDTPAAKAASTAPLSLAALATAAPGLASGETVQSVYLPPDMPDRAFIGVAKPGSSKLGDERIILVDRGTGRPLSFTDPDATFTGTLLKLHARWFAGIPGELFGSMVALMVFICLFSGVAIYAPYVKRMAFGMVRRGRGSRIVQLDLHNLVGVVLLGWAGIVTFTGICLGLGTILLGLWQATELKTMAGADAEKAPAISISIDEAASAAEAAMPDRAMQFAIYPGTDFSSPRHFAFLMYGRQRYNEHLFDIVLVDAETALVAAAKPLPWYLKIVVLSGPLHFGNYGGLPLKIFWVLNAWGTLFVTGNGAWLWWVRHRTRTSMPNEPRYAT
jgi:uncharacterized iron-regulated membrane protein